MDSESEGGLPPPGPGFMILVGHGASVNEVIIVFANEDRWAAGRTRREHG